MGVLKKEFVIAVVIDFDKNKKVIKQLDAFVNNHKLLFAKSKTVTNWCRNYVMFWDGSKEGWNVSNEGDRLRKKFLDILSKAYYPTIYHVIDSELEDGVEIKDLSPKD